MQAAVEDDQRAQLLGELFHSLGDAALLASFPTRTVLDVNPALLALFGYAREEIAGGTTEPLHVDAAQFAEFGRRIQAEFALGRVARFEWRLKRRDGSVFDASIIASAVRATDGAPVGVVAIIHDLTGERETQRSLAMSDARWRGLVESVTDYIFTVDRDGIIHDINRDAPGRRREEIIGTSFYSWLPPSEVAQAREQHERVFATGAPVTYVNRARAADGSHRVFETRVSPIAAGPESVVERAIFVSRDVTERSRLQTELARSEAKLRRLDESNVLGIAVADDAGRILEANDEWLRIIGHPREELASGALRWEMITPPEFRAQDERAMREMLERGSCTPYEKEYIRADGSRAAALVGAAFVDADRRTSIGFALDVSERKRAAMALASQQELAEEILRAQSQLGEGLAIVLAPHGRLRHANQALADLTGYSLDEMYAMPSAPLAIMAPEAAPTWRARYEALGRGEPVPARFESAIQRKDGVVVPVEIVGTDVKVGSDACRLYLLRDLRPVKEASLQLESARAALAQSEKLAALGTLVSGVAHEARTPLTVMMNASHLLRAAVERGQADPSVTALVEDILESATRLNGFVDELRRFTRMGTGSRAEISLDAPARDALRLFAQTHSDLAPIQTSLEPTIHVRANPAKLVQVVLNLLQNAVEASRGSADVRVATRNTPDGRAAIIVEDQGEGISEAVRLRMFDPLFTTKPDGTGLGLAIVRRIVDEHGGTIHVDSAPGKGTRFTVLLPGSP